MDKLSKGQIVRYSFSTWSGISISFSLSMVLDSTRLCKNCQSFILRITVHWPDSLVKDRFEIPLCECWTFQVFDSSNLFGDCKGLFVRYRLHLLRSQFFSLCSILSQIKLGSDEDNRYTWCVMLDFRIPLQNVSYWLLSVSKLTFALTLSNDAGPTILKQIKNTSVWG